METSLSYSTEIFSMHDTDHESLRSFISHFYREELYSQVKKLEMLRKKGQSTLILTFLLCCRDAGVISKFPSY